jgi:hypothetical protein
MEVGLGGKAGRLRVHSVCPLAISNQNLPSSRDNDTVHLRLVRPRFVQIRFI